MKKHSDVAWGIASKYSGVLASETRDLAAQIDAAMAVKLHLPDEWGEDMGDVLWWVIDKDGNPTEHPWVGSPLSCGYTVEAHTTTRIISQMNQDSDPKPTIERISVGGWVEDYYTHFSLIQIPGAPSTAMTKSAEPVEWQVRCMHDKGHKFENEWCEWRFCTKKWFDQVNADLAAGVRDRMQTRALYATPPSDAAREALWPLDDRQLWENSCITRAQLKSWTQSDLRSHTDGLRHTIGFLFDRLDKLAALSAAPVSAWQEALAKGFMTACSGDGEYQIKIGFESLQDMQDAHMALCKSAYARPRKERGIEAS